MGVYTLIEELGSASFVARLKRDHPKGTSVIIVDLNNLFYPILTSRGTVEYVDDIGCVHVNFAGTIVPLNYRLGDRWKIINGTVGLSGLLPLALYSLEELHQTVVSTTNMLM